MYSKLESLRGVAACMVVLYHSHFFIFDSPLDLTANAYLFVDFFFILSGFVMAYAYTDRIRQGLSPGTYVALRLGRIYPLHLFMLLSFVLYTGLKDYLHSIGIGSEQDFGQSNLYSFVTNLLLIHSLGVHDYLTWNHPSWSISVEFFTYLIFFALTKWIDNNKLTTPAIIVITSYAFLLLLDRNDLDITYDFGIVRCVAAFYLGVFLFRLRPLATNSKCILNLLEIASFFFMVLALSLAARGRIYQILTIISFFTVLLVYSSSASGFIGRIFHSFPMRSIGTWSYSIYMVHALVISFFDSFFKQVMKVDPSEIHGGYSLGINLMMLSLTILVSRFTYVYVEDKCRRIVKNRLRVAVNILPTV